MFLYSIPYTLITQAENLIRTDIRICVHSKNRKTAADKIQMHNNFVC